MKKYILSAIPFVIALICWILFNIIGSTVTPDGTLVEPFYLIGLGWLFAFVGIIAIIFCTITNIKKSNKKNH